MSSDRSETHRDDPVDDPVNHPSHYTFGKIEVVDAIEGWAPKWPHPWHRGNAVKYLVRAGVKDRDKTVEDLHKAIWYIEREIGLLKERT